ncbi:MAG: uroporphyrinogen-III synthase [Gammaproteobacteria bacterium]|nr:uroporphyrinogen-III synthase [Gammaproteobacteria bacterium]
MSDDSLQGVTVLVTRPSQQAGGLCDLIQHLGGKALDFPVIEIRNIEPDAQLQSTLAELDKFDIAVFISANAVVYALDKLPPGAKWPQSVSIAAIGRATAAALEAEGYRVSIKPEGRFSSEGLLATPAMQNVQNKRIIIFRGEGGRQALADSLQSRGAKTFYANVYQRVLPAYKAGEFAACWQQNVDMMVTTSSEGIKNLSELAQTDNISQVFQVPLVVMSERSAEFARKIGFNSDIIVVEEISDQGIVDALVKYKGLP